MPAPTIRRLRHRLRCGTRFFLVAILFQLAQYPICPLQAEDRLPSVSQVRKKIEEKRFSELEQLFARIQQQKTRTSAGGPIDIALLQKIFEGEHQENLKLKHILDEWVQHSPKSEIPLLFRSQFVYVVAWRVRGHFPPSQTDEQKLKRFERLIAHSYEDAERALAINPDNTAAIYRMLQVLRATGGDRKRFGKLFEHGTSIDRNNLALYLEMLLMLNPAWGGDAEKMFHFARTTASEASPDGPVSWVLVEAHMDRARFDPLESYLRDDSIWKEIEIAVAPLLKNYPDTVHYTRTLSRMAWSSGRIARAGELMEESTKRQPKNWKLWYDLAKFYEQQYEDRDAALDYLGKAITYNPDRAQLYQERAMLLSQGEDWKLAANDFAKLTELSPQNARAHYLLGRSLLELKQYDQALLSLNEAIDLLGNDSNKYALTARCAALLKLNQPQKALRDCDAALELDRAFEKALILKKQVKDTLSSPD